MAEYLASIFGTEKDKVNCSFYFKIGACRHGEQCSRLHNKPTFSQNAVANMTEVQAQQLFDEFFEEVFVECEEKYGEIEEMNVCDNLGDHLVGNVYIKRLAGLFDAPDWLMSPSNTNPPALGLAGMP
ncbi:hypothetical protein AAHC03_026684 [Spirometra sp. Aus1]